MFKTLFHDIKANVFVLHRKGLLLFKQNSLRGPLLGGFLGSSLVLSYSATRNNLAISEAGPPPTVVEHEAAAPIRVASRKTSCSSFGHNSFGELLINHNYERFTPERVRLAHSLQHCYASSRSSALLTVNGEVFVGGCATNDCLGLGLDDTANVPAPTLLSFGEESDIEIQQLSLHDFGGCAVDSKGSLFVFGEKEWRKENEGEVTGRPYPVPHPCRVVECAKGQRHLAFLDELGQVYTLGSNLDGQLGIGKSTVCETTKPLLVKDLPLPIKAIACGVNSTYRKSETAPKLVSVFQIKAVACGKHFTAVISDKGELFMTGANTDGQLGRGNTDDSFQFVKVELPSPAKQVRCGDGHVACLTKDGSFYLWGREGCACLWAKLGLTRKKTEKVSWAEGTTIKKWMPSGPYLSCQRITKTKQ
jgi:alpha-tubulin suppressor-like RCC1 family protein